MPPMPRCRAISATMLRRSVVVLTMLVAVGWVALTAVQSSPPDECGACLRTVSKVARLSLSGRCPEVCGQRQDRAKSGGGTFVRRAFWQKRDVFRF